MRKSALVYLLLIPLIFSACSSKTGQTKNFDYGKIENSIYKNEFFNFQLNLNENWQILSIEENKELLENQSKNLENITTALLLSTMQFELGKEDSLFNANLVVIAENIKNNKRINNEADYLMLTRSALLQQEGEREFLSKALETIDLDDNTFSIMRVKVEEQGVVYFQDYYTELNNGFAITLIQSYKTEEQKAVLDEIVESYKSSPPAP